MNDISSDDIFLLKQRLAEQEALIHALQEKLSNREREIDHLQAQLDKLRRMNFGSRSEKVSRRIAQMEADLNRLQKESDTLTGRVYDPAVQRPLRQTRTRKPFPESLPRDEKRLLPAAPCCPNCGGSLSYLGEDTAEQLELMRSAFRVIRTVREKHACTQCDAIVQAPAPSRPIERGIAGPGLLARVLTSKYAEHTPLYRQSEIPDVPHPPLSRQELWPDEFFRHPEAPAGSRFAVIHERQTSQFPDNLTIDSQLEGKVELLQRFDPRLTSLLQLGLHTALMPAVPFLLYPRCHSDRGIYEFRRN